MKNLIQVILKSIGAEPPEWFQVFPPGKVEIIGEDPAYMEEPGARSIIAAFKALGHDMVIDYEHQTLKDVEAPASGWVKEIAWRGDDRESGGLWARCEWTERAANFIRAKEYRYFSPVFWATKAARKIAGLYNIALTNQPRMINVQALAAKHQLLDDGGDLMFEWLKNFLKLGENATETEAKEALESLAAKAQAQESELVVLKAKPAAPEILASLGLDEKTTHQVVVAKIEALKAPAGAAVELSREVATLKQTIAGMKSEGLIAQALKEGKTSKDEIDKWGKALAEQNPEQFTLIVLSRHPGSVVPVGKLPDDANRGGETIQDEAVLTVAKMLGNTAEDLKKYAN